jgi:hypothetical protein
LLVVVEILVAEGEAEQSLAHHHRQRMFDETLVAGVGKAAGELFAEAQMAVHLARQQRTAVAGEMTTAEIRLHTARSKGLKSEGVLDTVCHRPFGCGL